MAINNKDIEELLNEGIIDAETKSRITNYYARKQRLQPSKLLLIFGILASVLVGLGIILIMAHNWDNLSKSIKTAIAFLPLLTSQALCFYTIKEKSESKLWKENCSVLLFLSVAAAIALTSQIYQIEGNERSFLVTWFLITIPIIYLMPSKALSLILISGVIRLLREGPTGIGNSEHFIPLDQLGIFLLVIPFYLLQIKNKDNGLSIKGHHWLVVGAILSMILPSIFDRGTLGLLFALCLFACLYGLGKLKYFTSESLSWNPYLVVGAIGTVITLYISTFINFWEEQEKNPLDIDFNLLYDLPILLIIGLSIFLLYKWIGDHNLKDINPIHLSFLLFIPIYFVGRSNQHFGMILSNILLCVIGLIYLRQGNRSNNFILLNFGLGIISTIIITRFFEMDISFLARGICFVSIGIGLFLANYQLIRQSKLNS